MPNNVFPDGIRKFKDLPNKNYVLEFAVTMKFEKSFQLNN